MGKKGRQKINTKIPGQGRWNQHLPPKYESFGRKINPPSIVRSFKEKEQRARGEGCLGGP